MSPGDRVGPATVVARIGATGPVARYRGEGANGREVEVLILAADAPNAARERFLRAHTALCTLPHPDVVATDWVGEVPGGAVAAVREWTTPLEATADAGDAERRLRALEGAVRAAGATLLATTTERDLRRRSSGHLCVAPWGITVPEDAPNAAPEAHRNAPPDAASALYGLGVALYRGLTGHTPVPAGLRTDEADAVLATAWRADLPYPLAQALKALVSRAPAERLGAVALLDTKAPPATLVTGSVKLTTRPESPPTPSRSGVTAARKRPRRPRAVVVLPARALAGLSPSERSAAAGWSNLPVAVLRHLESERRPVVVEGHPSATAARQRAAVLRRDAALPVEVLTPPGVLGALSLLVVALVGTGLLGAAALTSVAALGVAAVALFVVGLVGAARWGQRAARFRDAVSTRDADPVAAATSESLRAAWQRTATLRRQLATLDLPIAADADVREALTDIEERVAEIARVDAAVADALGATSPDHLRTRLANAARKATHDPSAAGERDALARVLSDVEAIEGRRAGIEEETARAHAALDALERTLPTRSSLHTELALEQVQRGADAARHHMKEPAR